MKRRDFLKGAATVGGALFLGKARAMPASALSATDVVYLGPEHIEVTRLALGSGSNGFGGASNQTRKLGVQGYAAVLREGYERGVRFWDSADMYGSHPHLAEALKSVPRERVAILTKTLSRNAKDVKADLDRFRRELNTDYIDILLLHCLTDGDWPRKLREVMDVVSEAKSKGIVRSHGVSCHSFEALQAASEEPWVEIDLARINPAGAVMDASVDEVVPVLRKMNAEGKGVIGMKIYGAGKLVNRRAECLKFVLGLGCVKAITLGIENSAELNAALEEIGKE